MTKEIPTLSVLRFFRSSLLDFFEDLAVMFPSERGDILVASVILQNAPVDDLIGAFDHYMSAREGELIRRIAARDDDYFIEHNVFDQISRSKHFERIWKEHADRRELINRIWGWVDKLVDLYKIYRDRRDRPPFHVPVYIRKLK